MTKRRLVNRTTKGWMDVEDGPPCVEAPPGVINCNERQPGDLASDPAHLAAACAVTVGQSFNPLLATRCATCPGVPWCHFRFYQKED